MGATAVAKTKRGKPTKEQRQAALSAATPERRRHDVITRTTTDQQSRGAVVERVVTARVIDRLLRDRRVDQRQYDAAVKLLRTWWRGKLMSGAPKVMDLRALKVPTADSDPDGLSQAQARQAYDDAMAKLTESQRHAVEMVVVWDHAPRWYVGTLCRGLDGLAAHYRL